MHSTKVIDLLIQDAGVLGADEGDKGWSFWFREGEGFSRHVDEVGQVTVEQISRPDADSYGDSSGEVTIAVQVNPFPEGGCLYFRKTGYADSYGDLEFDGALVEAKPVTKTVTVWE